MAVKCQKCGEENPENAIVCSRCGFGFRNRSTEGTSGIDRSDISRSVTRKEIEWTPLLIVIGAAYLISLSMYGTLSLYGSEFDLEADLILVLSFLGSTALIATIALVIYRKEDLAKKSLIIGMVLLICMLALRASVYLRVS